MRRSGVRIPLAPPQADIRSRMSVFCMPGVVLRCLLLCCLWRRTCCPVGRAAGCARGRRPAREPSAPRASLGASSRSPARPRRRPRAPQPGALAPSGTLHTGGACVAWTSPARPCHRPQAPQPGPPDPPAPSTPAAPGVLMVLYIVSRPGQAPPPPPVLSVTRVKPSSPLLAGVLSSVKPTSPLRGRYTRFRRYFIEQRRRGFHGGVLRLPHWCSRFHIEAR